jgi:hypothetical protein
VELRITNDRADPPILVKGLITKRTSAYSRNLFCDVSDPEETAFYDEDLTPVEKGHIYLWKENISGGVDIHLPYKIMDVETGALLQALLSYTSRKPYIARSIPQVLIAKPRSCLQHFSLSKSDFNIFTTRVQDLGGLVEKDEVDLGCLLSDMEKTVAEAGEVVSSIQSLRESRCSTTSETKLLTQEDLDEVLKEFAWFREQISELKSRNVKSVKLLSTLQHEIGRDTDYVRASTESERVSSAIAALNNINFSRFEREAIHKFRVDSGQADPFSKPAHIGDLTYEINQLRQWFPSLTKTSGHGDNLVITLSGIRIILTPDSVKVDGDPAALKPYTGSTGALATEGAPHRRRRNISPKAKS